MSRPQTVSTEKIIYVARAHFIERGHSATLNAIAKDLGVSHSALLQRFGSKRQLLIQAMRPPEDFSWSEAFLNGPPKDLDLAFEQLSEVSVMLVNSLNELMPQIRVLQSAGIALDEVFEDQLPLPLIACKRLTEWIERGIERGLFRCAEPAAVASTLVGAMFFRSRLKALFALNRVWNLDHVQDLETSFIGSHLGVLRVVTQSLLHPSLSASVYSISQDDLNLCKDLP